MCSRNISSNTELFSDRVCRLKSVRHRRVQADVPPRRTPVFCVSLTEWDRTGRGFGEGRDGCTISPCGLPPGVLTLILLHVSPISTNGAPIVPSLCAAVPSAQSPWVSKLGTVMFGLLPTPGGLHDNGRPHSHTHTHWLDCQHFQTISMFYHYCD